jgi:hypothetical protein
MDSAYVLLELPNIREGLLEWKHKLAVQEIPPEKQGDEPLCMNQYKVLFTTERQPQKTMDSLVTRPCTDTIVVLVKNQFYLLELKDGYGHPVD